MLAAASMRRNDVITVNQSIKGNDENELSANREFSSELNNLFRSFADNPVSRDKRERLPVGQTVARLRRKRETVEVNDRNDKNDNVNGAADDEITDQLNELSDEELAILARIVQDELDRYNPDAPVQNYQIVKLPNSLVTTNSVPQHQPQQQQQLQYDGDIDEDNDRRIFADNQQPEIVRPIIELPADEIYEMNIGEHMDEVPEKDAILEYVLVPAKELIVVPNNTMDEEEIPIDENTLDDLELRTRIAALADALNERATRGF